MEVALYGIIACKQCNDTLPSFPVVFKIPETIVAQFCCIFEITTGN
jgi:hypothetical protein